MVKLLRHGASNGARALARALGIRMLRLKGSRYRYRSGDKIINWGSSTDHGYPSCAFINDPAAVAVAQSKTDTYRVLEEAGIPTCEWTDDRNEALRWCATGEARVIHRALDRGSQGRGMTVYSADGTEWSAPTHEMDALAYGGFFVKVFGNVLHNKEYRIHVVNGEVIDRQEKRRRNGHERGVNPYIRSARNGWVFCRDGLQLDEAVDQAAIEAVEALGLDFGAVDIARSERGEVCVYEVNTAPGLEGTTLDSYTRALGFRRSSRENTTASGWNADLGCRTYVPSHVGRGPCSQRGQ